MKKKIYIVRKFVLAHSIEEALDKEKTIEPDDCYMDEYSIKEHKEDLTNEA